MMTEMECRSAFASDSWDHLPPWDERMLIKALNPWDDFPVSFVVRSLSPEGEKPRMD